MIGESQIQGRTLGFVGQERVKVVELNLALDRPAAEMAAGVGG